MQEIFEQLKIKKTNIEKNINFFKQKINEIDQQEIEEKNQLTLPFQNQIKESEYKLQNINEEIIKIENQIKNNMQVKENETTPLLQEHV
ncbi:MAG: hypothetical protein H9Q65_04455, partial [Spiroplasma ixodetis]|nr:hypothetical protein [Spiroplasma ixodetis]